MKSLRGVLPCVLVCLIISGSFAQENADECAAAADQIRGLEGENKQLKRQLMDLEAYVSDLESRRSQHEADAAAAEDERGALAMRVQQWAEAYEQQGAQLKAQQQAVDEATAQLVAAQEEKGQAAAAYEARLAELQDLLQSSNAQASEMQAGLAEQDALREKVAELKSKLSAAKKNAHDNQMIIEKLKIDLALAATNSADALKLKIQAVREKERVELDFHTCERQKKMLGMEKQKVLEEAQALRTQMAAMPNGSHWLQLQQYVNRSMSTMGRVVQPVVLQLAQDIKSGSIKELALKTGAAVNSTLEQLTPITQQAYAAASEHGQALYRSASVSLGKVTQHSKVYTDKLFEHQLVGKHAGHAHQDLQEYMLVTLRSQPGMQPFATPENVLLATLVLYVVPVMALAALLLAFCYPSGSGAAAAAGERGVGGGGGGGGHHHGHGKSKSRSKSKGAAK